MYAISIHFQWALLVKFRIDLIYYEYPFYAYLVNILSISNSKWHFLSSHYNYIPNCNSFFQLVFFIASFFSQNTLFIRSSKYFKPWGKY